MKTVSNRQLDLFAVIFLLLFFLTNFSYAKEFAVTIDLCPSHKPYEARLFNYLDHLGKKLGRPLPVGVSVSGKWIRQHPRELEKIKKCYLDITWINHSLTHPIANDFLNNPTVNFTQEVMGNIYLMKANGLSPSIYFRFPGLRHSSVRLAELKALGYRKLDADAWLAKGKKIKDGSIVLVHGNGNEPKGVTILLRYLRTQENDILNGRIKVVNFREINTNNI
ncbi:MAG: hypothetical protein KKC80_02845 [Candidatus Margulisbacteria bacterium]|nr:hypothetical protein [Candidatus Margulisiibacteriota bacterium]MBU1616802.1 hypothetical protein [Candidatus Margulisiibacteriota bacterium]